MFGRIRARLNNLNPFRALLCAGIVIALTVVMSVHFLPDRVALRVGDRSPNEIRAGRTVSYVDTEATERQRKYAADLVENVYDLDPASLAIASRAVTQVFEDVLRARSDSTLSNVGLKSKRLGVQLGSSFTENQLRYLVTAALPVLERLKSTSAQLVDVEMLRPIRRGTDDIQRAKSALDDAAQAKLSMKAEVAIVNSIAAEALRPNRILNVGKTAQLKEVARTTVREVTGQVRLGDPVVREGELFTQQDMDKCTALGLISPRMDLTTGMSLFGLAAGMVVLVLLYILRYDEELFSDTRRLALLAGIVMASVFGLKAFGTMFGISLTGVQFGYLGVMAVVSAGMIIAVLLSPTLAMLVTALLSVQSGIIMNHEIRFSVMTLLCSLVGILCVSNIRDRSDALRASLAIGGTNLALVWILGGLLGDSFREVISGSVLALGASVLAVCIFWYGVLVLEKPFGILTHVWLLELSESSMPLLKQLCITTPGTYAHSIMVGNLAEAGAEAIGADTLFCRVASYYHDVGKMKRPQFFVENQGGENIHDRLNPSLSALIIASHVRDGVQLAQEYRLPQRIIDAIAEHHGTSLIRFFYHLAITEGGNCAGHRDPVLEQHFRYDGPKPQTRESGIIMLADTVEAAARCVDKPTPARIQGLIESLVHEKLTDGQLDESNLTFKDIQQIQTAFIRVLSATFHRRTEYPDLIPQEAITGKLSADPASPANANLLIELPDSKDRNEAVVAGRPSHPAR